MIASDRLYVGKPGAKIQGQGGDGPVWHVKGDNVKIDGLEFDGGGVKLDSSPSGYNTNIIINHNIFNLSASGQNNNAFNAMGSGQFAIYGYNYNNLTIANNEVYTKAGMHIDHLGTCVGFEVGGNSTIEDNYINYINNAFAGNDGDCVDNVGYQSPTNIGTPNPIYIRNNYYANALEGITTNGTRCITVNASNNGSRPADLGLQQTQTWRLQAVLKRSLIYLPFLIKPLLSQENERAISKLT